MNRNHKNGIYPCDDCQHYDRCKNELLMCKSLHKFMNGWTYDLNDERIPTEKMYRKNFK